MEDPKHFKYLHITESLLDEEHEEDDLEDQDEPGEDDVTDSLQEMVASENEPQETDQPKEPPPPETDIEMEIKDGGETKDGGDKSLNQEAGSTDDDPKDQAGNIFFMQWVKLF